LVWDKIMSYPEWYIDLYLLGLIYTA